LVLVIELLDYNMV